MNRMNGIAEVVGGIGMGAGAAVSASVSACMCVYMCTQEFQSPIFLSFKLSHAHTHTRTLRHTHPLQ